MTFWEWSLTIGIGIAILAIGVILVVFRVIDRVLGFLGTVALAIIGIAALDSLIGCDESLD